MRTANPYDEHNLFASGRKNVKVCSGIRVQVKYVAG